MRRLILMQLREAFENNLLVDQDGNAITNFAAQIEAMDDETLLRFYAWNMRTGL